jgi:phosphoglucosamine mutase
MRKLFGTDGIRGKANQFPMTAEMALRLGRAVATLFENRHNQSKIIIGKDTRVSGYMFEYALVAGICSLGGDALLTGVLPTPAVAYLTGSTTEATAGIVISASHNPFYDNGIKVFNGDGYKLSDEMEAEIELLIMDDDRFVSACESLQETGTVVHLEDAAERYMLFAKQTLPSEHSLSGMRIVLDCSNGATYQVAPRLFAELGAETESIGVQPDGKNINASCGSEHPQTLIQKVLQSGADVGLAFDGDGDRLIAVDEKGQILSGDRILAICGKFLQAQGSLKNNIVVSTVMSNIGLSMALKELGINHLMADVGDRYVLEKMISAEAVLGGEDSGHMIFLDHHTTGDGVLTALRLMEVMQSESKSLSDLSSIMTVYPQVLVNVAVRSKPAIESIEEIMAVIQEVETNLGENGRVLVRYSGTQPICRIMVEGPNETETQAYCSQLSDIIEKTIGSDRSQKR